MDNDSSYTTALRIAIKSVPISAFCWLPRVKVVILTILPELYGLGLGLWTGRSSCALVEQPRRESDGFGIQIHLIQLSSYSTAPVSSERR
jgi:hypothetical protein